MKEPKVKLQHYVPRVYLKNFSNFNGKEYYIWVFDKEKEDIFQTNINDIAFEREFYDKVSEEQITEKNLRDIETKVDGIIRKLISVKDISKLSEDEKDALSEFVSYQMIRTKETREEIKDSIQQLSDKIGNQASKELRAKLNNALEEESIKELHKDIINSSEDFKEILKIMKWILIENKSKFPFWTSDNPVAKYNSIDHYPYGNAGLTSLGIEIHFPISSNITLLICDPVSFKLESGKKTTKDYRHVIRERDLQVRDSTRFIFSNESKFDFAKVMLKEKPSLGDPNRKRVKVN